MNTTVPLAFVGDINGDFELAFKELANSKSRTKTPECDETVFVCGDFFGNIPPICQEFIDGYKKVPVPVYILGATCEGQAELYSRITGEMCEVMPNVTYLGKFGVLTMAEGLTVAYLSGIEGVKANLWTFTKENVFELIKKCSQHPKIDVLITYQWPLGVKKTSSSSKWIGLLVASIKPRMHFAVNEKINFSGTYLPYGNNLKKTTLFNGLKSLDKHEHGKWVYRIKLPVIDDGVDPTITVPRPFTEFQDGGMNSIFFDTKRQSQQKGSTKDKDDKKRRNMELHIDPKSCWYCMHNPYVDWSLIIAVANHVYVKMCMCPVVDGHVIILPIKHIGKFSNAPSGVEIETHYFLESLAQYYSSQQKALIWFERCFKSAHLQINAIPVDSSIAAKGVIDHSLDEMIKEKRLEAKKFNLKNELILKKPLEARVFDLGTVVNLYRNIKSSNYFYLQIGNNRAYVINIDEDTVFSVTFGRRVIARVLEVPEREYGRNCVEDDYTRARKIFSFRQDFEPYVLT